jgi:hypothetical protein
MQNRNYRLILTVSVLYLFRLLFLLLGYLKNYQWVGNTDETHIYEIGLRYFSTGEFPFWGPDIVYIKKTLIGGLQGLLVGGPLFIWQHPFAPYLLLFIINSAALIYLSWYVSKLFPGLPKWLVYSLAALAPFTIHTGLHIINPAYVLCISIPFILSVLEILRLLPVNLISKKWKFLWLGFGITSVFQIHASWVVFLVLAGISIVYYWIKNPNLKDIFQSVFFSLMGFLIGFLPLIPVIHHYGFSVLFSNGAVVNFTPGQAKEVFRIFFYLVTSAGYEINLFDINYHFDALIRMRLYPMAILFGVLQVAGLLLFAAQFLLLFWKRWRPYMAEYRKFLMFNLGLVLLVTLFYLFSFVPPRPHALIFFFPLSFILLTWFINNLSTTTRFRIGYTKIFIAALVLFYISLIYVTDKLPDLGYREKAFKAIDQKNPAIFETPRYEEGVRR